MITKYLLTIGLVIALFSCKSENESTVSTNSDNDELTYYEIKPHQAKTAYKLDGGTTKVKLHLENPAAGMIALKFSSSNSKSLQVGFSADEKKYFINSLALQKEGFNSISKTNLHKEVSVLEMDIEIVGQKISLVADEGKTQMSSPLPLDLSFNEIQLVGNIYGGSVVFYSIYD